MHIPSPCVSPGKLGFVTLDGWSDSPCFCVVDGAAEDIAVAPCFPGSYPEPAGTQPLHHCLAQQLLVHRDPESAQAFVWEEQRLQVHRCPHDA